MHRTLRYQISGDTLGISYKLFTSRIKSYFVNFHTGVCNIVSCHFCENSNLHCILVNILCNLHIIPYIT